MKLEAKQYAIEDLRKLDAEKLYLLVKQGVTIASKAKTAQEDQKSSAPAMGKIICVLAENLEAAKAAKTVPSAKSLKEYFAEVTKGGKIKNHWYQCKDAFAAYVQSELMTEKDYDSCSANSLELAGQVYKAVADLGKDLNHPAIRDTAIILTERVDGYQQALRTILTTVKPKDKLSTEKAAELIARLVEDGHTTTMVAAVGAEAANVENEDDAKKLFISMDLAMQCWSQNPHHDEETINVWVNEIPTHDSASQDEPAELAA